MGFITPTMGIHAPAAGPANSVGRGLVITSLSRLLRLRPGPGPPGLSLSSKLSRDSPRLPPPSLHVGRSPLVYIARANLGHPFPGPPAAHPLPPIDCQLTGGLTLALPGSCCCTYHYPSGARWRYIKKQEKSGLAALLYPPPRSSYLGLGTRPQAVVRPSPSTATTISCCFPTTAAAGAWEPSRRRAAT